MPTAVSIGIAARAIGVPIAAALPPRMEPGDAGPL